MSIAEQTGSVLVEVLRYNEGRVPRAVRLKLKRMAADSFAFFRGTDHLFAASWGELHPPDPGPDIPLCGDLHLENFGAYRDDEGEFLFDINDFDEAVVAPCSLDVVRCATSILLAAELWKLTPLRATGMVLRYLDAYRATVTTPLVVRAVDAAAPRLTRGPIEEILGKTALGDQVELLDAHTETLRHGGRRIIRSKDKHPEIDEARAAAVTTAVTEYGRRCGRAEFFHVLDVTGRLAGIGSLGVERFTVLVAGGGSSHSNRLLDVKRCIPSALQPCASRTWPFPDASDAARVVRAQKLLQARTPAGLDVVQVGETPFRMRESIPEENRSSLDRFHERPSKLAAAIEAAGRLTALSHLRGATGLPGEDRCEPLRAWATGPALDSVLAAAARYAELTRQSHKQFRAERRTPESLPEELRRLAVRS
jgi:uncharacterized protein (DUF2252 family)